jgi:methionine-S-sulfoxide reductase
VLRTRVGYTGGTHKDPTYTRLGDHSEAVQIDFDPSQVSYSQLLEIFWDDHSPTRRSWSRQYRSAIFFHDETQKRLALASKERLEVHTGRPVFTEIEPAGEFYRAEDYHQKYRLRHHRLMDEFRAMYPDERLFVDSTAVARVNGYVAGHGSLAALQAELAVLGLSTAGQGALLEILRRNGLKNIA